MLSILIPVYHIDIRDLVAALHEQAQKMNIPFEIICLDDASSSSYQNVNREIARSANTIYDELRANVGRSKIRNRLADLAKYENLLFIDCDAKIVKPDFIKTYLSNLQKNTVLVGGRVYPDRPTDRAKLLHWKVGRLREQGNKSAFQSNNFLISKKLFQAHPFDESLTGYGHEDTLFGYQLTVDGILIKYIDNPVLHDGLEDSRAFIEKQEQAIENLIILKRKFPHLETKLTQTADWANRNGLMRSLSYIFDKFGDRMKTKFQKGYLPLPMLDLYKICYYLKKEREL